MTVEEMSLVLISYTVSFYPIVQYAVVINALDVVRTISIVETV